MPTFHIVQDGQWFGIAIRSGAYQRLLPTMYSTRDAANRCLSLLLGR